MTAVRHFIARKPVLTEWWLLCQTYRCWWLVMHAPSQSYCQPWKQVTEHRRNVQFYHGS